MDSSTQTMAEDAKSMSDLFELVEKLTIQLNNKDKELETNKQQNMIELRVKDEELTKEKQEKQKLSADLELEKARANRADELETKLAGAYETNSVLQKSLWQSFPSDYSDYYIKVKVSSGSENVQYQYLYVDSSGLRLDNRWFNPSKFNFTENSNGTFSIHSIVNDKGKYLKTQTSNFSRVIFSAIDEDCAGQFVLFFHPQSQQSGLLVDFSSSTGSFLYLDNRNYVVANSSDPPDNKFLIVPVLDGQ